MFRTLQVSLLSIVVMIGAAHAAETFLTPCDPDGTKFVFNGRTIDMNEFGDAKGINRVALPPSQYRHLPTDLGTIEIKVIGDRETVYRTCRGEGLGCYIQFSSTKGVRKQIVLPSVDALPFEAPYNRTMQDAILIHEIAHVLGWSQSHPHDELAAANSAPH